ncbi:putative leucine-rich repeat receptor-like serine/threonine-protein kinase [Ananas comosus]|uniref:non-specific serine/threonine protein kinase n=1 Tax=Ananas comosus TaxID=4615 RepID=A0A199UX88_ANACO|nr:putative leucine-rich repeat receptor-like serine/threonine-protein kinase [Ananas comosus]
MFTSLILVLLFSRFAAVAAAVVAPVPGQSRDRAALLAFRASISDGGQIDDWGSPDICGWTGVTCHLTKRRVLQLILTGQGLRGAITPAVANLSFLAVLDLSNNFLTGGIPAELGALSRLKQLSLANNLLSGPVPAELGLLRRLVYLDLGGNRLSERIPGTLFCNCSSLQYVDLSNNSLAGEIPYSAQCRLADLRFLLLWSNNLDGPIPPTLSNSSMLEWVDTESNFLSGELPSDIFDKTPRLQYLYLSYNNFSSGAGNTNLEPFFASLRNCTRLQELELAGNGLGGAIPPSVGELSPNLRQLDLEENFISGPIPVNISNLVNLTYLNLSNNYLNGSIPPEISRLRKLERVYLLNNFLTGEIPPSLGEIPHLGLVDFSGNRLSATIPDTFANLTQLRRLMLHNNMLSGAIPPSLGNCMNLEILDLSHNRLSGIIPADVAALSSLKLFLNLSSNLLEGPIPLELSKMDMILALDLSSNNLSGVIPPQLGGCIALEYLNLSGNSLRGALPSSIGALPYLRVLDLSANGLVGAIPQSLQASDSLRQLNISYNNFSGVIPNGGVFSSLSADSFLGNSGLCGSIAGVDSCGSTRVRVRRSAILPIVLTLIGTPCVLFLFLYPAVVRLRAKSTRLLTFKRQILVDSEESNKEKEHRRISHRELVEATRGFADSTLIGAGRFGLVYKGVLRDQTRVAVKVLDPKNGAEISGSFERECQVLKRTRHRNLIRVITTCSQPDFKALVLPLMPKGSLESYLYPSEGPSRGLHLNQLLNIISDVAEGMAYLHHYSPVRVVHCDLKPSNVLLDDDMRAVVSDFGIARLMREAGDESNGSITHDHSTPYNSITGLLQGSVGYIAPEYGLGGNPSIQGDVYSFGVLVLELITGKRPTNVVFHEGLTLHEWVKHHYPHDIESIISQAPLRRSPSFADSLSYQKLAWDVMFELVELGLVCTQFSPSRRPTMVDVAHEITLLKEDLAKHSGDASESCSTPDSSF